MVTFHLTGAIFKKSVILRTQPTKRDLNYIHPHVDNWRLGFGHSLDTLKKPERVFLSDSRFIDEGGSFVNKTTLLREFLRNSQSGSDLRSKLLQLMIFYYPLGFGILLIY